MELDPSCYPPPCYPPPSLEGTSERPDALHDLVEDGLVAAVVAEMHVRAVTPANRLQRPHASVEHVKVRVLDAGALVLLVFRPVCAPALDELRAVHRDGDYERLRAVLLPHCELAIALDVRNLRFDLSQGPTRRKRDRKQRRRPRRVGRLHVVSRRRSRGRRSRNAVSRTPGGTTGEYRENHQREYTHRVPSNGPTFSGRAGAGRTLESTRP